MQGTIIPLRILQEACSVTNEFGPTTVTKIRLMSIQIQILNVDFKHFRVDKGLRLNFKFCTLNVPKIVAFPSKNFPFEAAYINSSNLCLPQPLRI